MFNNPNPQYGAQIPQQMPFGPMYQYGQVQPPKMTQTLTPEQMNRLRSTGGGFSLQIPETEMLQALCTHKYNNTFDMIRNDDGTVTCKICGKTFSLLQRDKEEVTAAVNVINDFLQSTKTMYLDIPEETARSYFQIIPLINRLPELYKLAVDDFNKYNGANNFYQQNTNAAGFNALANLMSPTTAMGMPMGQFGNPMMGGQMMNPMMPQQPQMNPMMPQQAPMGANPFGYYGMPQQPQMNPMMGQMNPMMGQQMPMGYPQMNPMMGQMNPMMQQQQQAQQNVAMQNQAQTAPTVQAEAPVVQQTKQMSV